MLRSPPNDLDACCSLRTTLEPGASSRYGGPVCSGDCWGPPIQTPVTSQCTHPLAALSSKAEHLLLWLFPGIYPWLTEWGEVAGKPATRHPHPWGSQWPTDIRNWSWTLWRAGQLMPVSPVLQAKARLYLRPHPSPLSCPLHSLTGFS